MPNFLIFRFIVKIWNKVCDFFNFKTHRNQSVKVFKRLYIKFEDIVEKIKFRGQLLSPVSFSFPNEVKSPNDLTK
jgi:uncharacterized protein YecE (DUF72 family)